jgi:hypothetical protein
MTLPLAHVGHYLWIFYLLPVIFVILGILRTVWLERSRGKSDGAGPSGDEYRPGGEDD